MSNMRLFEIGKDGKHIFVLKVPELSESRMSNLLDNIKSVKKDIERWWVSDEKFYIVVVEEGFEFKIIKAEEDEG